MTCGAFLYNMDWIGRIFTTVTKTKNRKAESSTGTSPDLHETTLAGVPRPPGQPTNPLRNYDLHANYTYIGAQNNSVNHWTEGLDISPDHNPLKTQSGWHTDGASIELLWRAISPYSHPVELAFYVEPEFGRRENGSETRAIIQKDFLNDRLIVHANVWLEFDSEQGTNLGAIASSAPPSFEKTRATYLEEDFGASYRFRRNWSFGFELRNHTGVAGNLGQCSRQSHAGAGGACCHRTGFYRHRRASSRHELS